MVGIVALFMVLPLILTFNDVLVRIALRISIYKWLQDVVTPIQAGLVKSVVGPFVPGVFVEGDKVTAAGQTLKITWNCMGWQSLILYLASVTIAFKGISYTMISKFQAMVLGIIGLFWVNILRMSFTVILAAISMPVFKLIYHDYLAAATTILFLVIYWWFSFKYVLEKKP